MAITKKTLMEELDLMVRDDITSQETIIRLSEENKILKDKIDKAIEYIEKEPIDDEIEFTTRLLNILKGEK